MREDVPRAGQAYGTPPQHQRNLHHHHRQEPHSPPGDDDDGGSGVGGGGGGDLERSDSYSLARGGKVVSSRPWSTQHHQQVVVNMHLVDVQKGNQHTLEARKSAASSGISSSSDSDSDSSDSDGTSEEEYEVRTPARVIDHTPYTLPEEDEEEEEEGRDDDDEEDEGVEAGEEENDAVEDLGDHECLGERNNRECVELGGRLCEEERRLPGDGHSRPHLADIDKTSDSALTVEDKSSSEEDDTESEETESTVRARQVGVTGGGVAEEVVQAATDEDHNDTLSTLSGDLSFDDRDVISPPRENGMTTTSVSEVGSGVREQASPPATSAPISAISKPTQATIPESQVENHSVVKDSVNRNWDGRAPPEGGGESVQRERVRAGVFCISGYPRNTPEPAPRPSHHASSKNISQSSQPSAAAEDCNDCCAIDGTSENTNTPTNSLKMNERQHEKPAKRREFHDRSPSISSSRAEGSGTAVVTPRPRSTKSGGGSSATSSSTSLSSGSLPQRGTWEPPPPPRQKYEDQRTHTSSAQSPIDDLHVNAHALEQLLQQEIGMRTNGSIERSKNRCIDSSVGDVYNSNSRQYTTPSPSPSVSSTSSCQRYSRSPQPRDIQQDAQHLHQNNRYPSQQQPSPKHVQQQRKRSLPEISSQPQPQQRRHSPLSQQQQQQRLLQQREEQQQRFKYSSRNNSRGTSSTYQDKPEEPLENHFPKEPVDKMENTEGINTGVDIYTTENGNLDEEENDAYDDSDEVVINTPKRYPPTELLGTGAVQLYPRENGTTSRMYHSDDSAVRRMYHTEGGALRRMYHSLSDYGMYPAYLSGLGLSTIVPIEPGDRVCGGSGLRSPSHLVATTSSTHLMPRLLTTPGLSGSASRLSTASEGGGRAGGSGGGGAFVGLPAQPRLGGSYTALASSTVASSGYGSGITTIGVGAVVPSSSSSRHEDSEDLSDVSSGATSEDSARRRRRRSAQPMKGEASVSGNEDFEWVRASPMLTGLLDGHVTRLATPPDHRGHSLRTSLATPPESGEEGSIVSAHRHRQYPRPPPVPRPRTIEAGELIPHRPLRDHLRDGLRDSRDGMRDRLYSPSRDLTGHRRSRDSSIERSGRDSSCERVSVSSLHQHNHHHHHLATRLPQHACECPSCWCDDEEGGYDSCDERHHHHRHSYHEGLHHAHLHQLQPHQHHHHVREGSRERRTRGQGSGDSGRSSPCCCRHCHHLGSLSSLSSHDYCANNRLALPCTSKGSSLEDRVNRLEGDKDSLQLQVTVLSEQVEAQTEKIQDLESILEEKKELLRKTEDQLQKEVMTRTSLETQRLELFSEISNLKLRQAAYERENADLRDKIRRADQHSDHAKAQTIAVGVSRSGSGRSATPAAASTPIHSIRSSPDSPLPSHQLAAQMANSPSPSSISTLSTIPSSSPKISPAQPLTVSPTASPIAVASHDAREFLPPRTPPPNARRKIEQFGTIPRQREGEMGGASARTKGVMFGKGLHFLPFRVSGKRSTSAPNLAETEMQMIDDMPEGDYCPSADGVTPPASSLPRINTLAGHRSPTTQHKATGIKKIFTRLRRSSSGHLDSDLGEGDFRRGGLRATASARLGWTSPNNAFKEPNEAFGSWNIETVEGWLAALGLSQYCAAVRSWSGAGHHLSRVTPQQLERDLGFRHPLHRKKVQLAISARLSGDQLNTPLARLDHAWVLRWLDDVGLPQYKDAFSEARIDGRVLNCLTYDDLAFLRLTNLLHVTSLKRGIQVLREHNFDPSVLKRRSVPEEDQRSRTASSVALWTNHRVMEWLRTVDLSEYAPNLRGSGVHGALMVYEVKFTSELLASLLSIPCGKTLLRRHLNTHFKELVGLAVVQEKRELEAGAGYTPLTTSAKVKMPKKSQFSLKRRKTKSDLEFDDLLCPLDEKPPLGAIQDREKETNGDSRLC